MFWLLWSCVTPTPQIDTPASQSVQTKETQKEKATPPLAKAIPESSLEEPETTFRVLGALEMPLGKTFQAASMGKNVPSMYFGDRLWITAETPIQLHLYAVSVYQQSRYRLIWTSSPGRQDREVTLFPKGLTIDQAYLEMDTFLLIGSNEPIQWLTDKLDIRCDDWRGKMPPKTPTDTCGFLHGLHWIKPGRIRGPGHYPRETSSLTTTEGSHLIAAVGSGAGRTITVAELQFSPQFTPRQ